MGSCVRTQHGVLCWFPLTLKVRAAESILVFQSLEAILPLPLPAQVAALSGDARRCLDICRRAVEIADASSSGKKKAALVGIQHVEVALKEMFSSPKIKAMMWVTYSRRTSCFSHLQKKGGEGWGEKEKGRKQLFSFPLLSPRPLPLRRRFPLAPVSRPSRDLPLDLRGWLLLRTRSVQILPSTFLIWLGQFQQGGQWGSRMILKTK